MKKTKLGTYIANREGIAATEFALMAPPLLLMLVGLIDYGTYLNRTIKLENTAYAAAQYIRGGGTEADLETDLLLNGNLGLTAANVDTVTVNVTYVYQCEDGIPVASDTDCGTGDYLREYIDVSVSETLDPIIPYPGIESLDLSGNVRLQND